MTAVVAMVIGRRRTMLPFNVAVGRYHIKMSWLTSFKSVMAAGLRSARSLLRPGSYPLAFGVEPGSFTVVV